MCIVFFYQSELCHPSGYRLILASNRDEVWNRPTKLADFRGPQKSCICGLDQTSGKEGGTWLAMSKTGRIGVLLNITGQFDPSKEGRGLIVVNYVSGSEDILVYGERIRQQKQRYNGLNLLLFDLGKKEDSLPVKPLYITNATNYSSCVEMRTLPANHFFGVSNSPIEYPFRKVECGKSRFGQVVSQFPTVTSKDNLTKHLMDLMLDQTPFLPDPVLESVHTSIGNSPTHIRQVSAINVLCPVKEYGTRTTTLILVDGRGNVDYVERTVDQSTQNGPSTSTVHKTFSLLQA